MNDHDIYALYSEQFRMIDDNLDDLVRQAQSFTEANAIIDSWKQANLNYLRARNKLFSVHAAQIQALVDEFSDAHRNIKRALEDLQRGIGAVGTVSQLLSFAVDKGKRLQESVSA
jgi:hypothetical protein